jgi:hypothetical protein
LIHAAFEKGHDTFIAAARTPLWIAKCKLDSPSVTNEIRAWPPGVSGTSPARIAARRIWFCSFPSQPFGCESTKSMSSFTVSHRSCPFAWVSCTYDFEHWRRYWRKSAKTSTTVLFKGKGGICSAMFFPAPTLERRCSLNLKEGLVLEVFANYDGNAPLCLDPAAIFCGFVHAIARCFGADCLNLSLGIIVDDSGYLRGAANLLMGWEPWSGL